MKTTIVAIGAAAGITSGLGSLPPASVICAPLAAINISIPSLVSLWLADSGDYWADDTGALWGGLN